MNKTSILLLLTITLALISPIIAFITGERALVWRLSSFQGGSEVTLDGRIDLLPATREKPWVRPPIAMEFQIPMHSGSGVQVKMIDDMLFNSD